MHRQHRITYSWDSRIEIPCPPQFWDRLPRNRKKDNMPNRRYLPTTPVITNFRVNPLIIVYLPNE